MAPLSVVWPLICPQRQRKRIFRMELNRIYTERSYKVLFLLIYENNILGKKTLVIMHLRSLKAKFATFILRSFLRAQAKHRTGMSMPEPQKQKG